MKIVALETIQLGEFPNTLHLQAHTDAGVNRLGETRNGASCVAAWIHEYAAGVRLPFATLLTEQGSST
jgi:hypothetical protein